MGIFTIFLLHIYLYIDFNLVSGKFVHLRLKMCIEKPPPHPTKTTDLEISDQNPQRFEAYLLICLRPQVTSLLFSRNHSEREKF